MAWASTSTYRAEPKIEVLRSQESASVLIRTGDSSLCLTIEEAQELAGALVTAVSGLRAEQRVAA